MAVGLGMRTIWISLRAINYTDRAFQAAIGNLKNLNKEERDHIKNALRMYEVSRMNIQAGMLYSAMASMVTGQLFNLMSATEVGAASMSQFKQIIDEVKVAFADTFFEVLEPVIDVVKGFLNVMKDNAPLRYAVVYITLIATAALGLYGTYKLLSGIYTHIIAKMTIENFTRVKGLKLKFAEVMANIKLASSNHALALSLLAVGVAAGVGFGIFFALRDALGPIPAALFAVAAALAAVAIQAWLVAGATSVITSGMAAWLGLAAVGAAAAGTMAVAAGIKSFAVGTRALPYTGYFFGHKGEMLYNPQTNRPVGIRDVFEGERESSVTHQDIDINIEHLHTKSDIDELDDRLGKVARRKMRNSR